MAQVSKESYNLMQNWQIDLRVGQNKGLNQKKLKLLMKVRLD